MTTLLAFLHRREQDFWINIAKIGTTKAKYGQLCNRRMQGIYGDTVAVQVD